MKLKIIILSSILLVNYSCGIFKKTTSKTKLDSKIETEVIKSDSTKVVTSESFITELGLLTQDIYESADSIKIKIIEETEISTITKDIIVYKPVKNTTTDLKTEKQQSTVTVDSLTTNKVDSTSLVIEKTSSVNTQTNGNSFNWFIPCIVLLIVIIIILYLLKKWTSGVSLLGILKKLFL